MVGWFVFMFFVGILVILLGVFWEEEATEHPRNAPIVDVDARPRTVNNTSVLGREE